MSNKAFAGLENLAPKTVKGKPGPKPRERSQPPKKVAVPVIEDEEEQETEPVVRVPRTTPTSQMRRVEQMSEAETLLAHTGFGDQEHTERRREKVLVWMLNGHLHNGQIMSVSELAASLDTPLKTVQNDVATLKEKMGEFYTEADDKDIPAMAHMLMEMKFQDRGRGLALYHIIMNDINEADREVAKLKAENKPPKNGGLTGRDRAAMYSAALTALDLSNKATNGMESLFKLTGGAQRLQTIIKAKHLTINNNSLTIEGIQQLISHEMGGLLPSMRKANPEMPLPKVLELDATDRAILKIPEGRS